MASHHPRQLSNNEEYSRNLPTISFLDMSSKVHHRLIDSYARLSDFLLMPSQVSFKFDIHSLPVLEYYDITFQTFTAFTELLPSVDRARVHHRSIRNLLVQCLSSRPHEGNYSDEYGQLTSLVTLDNPLCPSNLSLFHSVQSKYGTLMQKLTGAHRRAFRRAAVRWLRWLERVGAAELDEAARGAYIVGRDLETLSRMVQRVHDQVEHQREMIRMVVRSRDQQLTKEVARKVEEGAAGVEEQVEELEEHVFLCLIAISRSTRMAAKQMREGRESRVATVVTKKVLDFLILLFCSIPWNNILNEV